MSDHAAATDAATLLVALVADALLGEPAWLYRHVPHPVVLIGAGIAKLERRWFDPLAGPRRRRLAGVVLLAAVASAAVASGVLICWLARQLTAGWLLEGLLMSTLLAQRSLVDHVRDVATGLRAGLPAGRHAVSMIVGRDPERLDASGVGRAAVESLAENLADAVVAPLFWAAVAGLPGMLAYKAINTLDSMVGHRSERYRDFGWASARCDDLVNFVPARLTGTLLCLAGGSPLRSVAAMWRDAPRHRSPNAGWPEAAMAGALDLRLAGPRAYSECIVEDGWMGNGRAEVTPGDVDRAIALAWRAWWLLVASVVLVLVLGF